ncbi:formyltetrahydrofolate-dependentphosphoribosylglycinamide formyltransferase [Mizugakiibacter sediminis]|uniref:Phosphoribosylglycinamide formyltransferase n=1 Tax=Mizugakiibacter sediminis TaxID=1475481 RepID=A0A0K8QNK3_9GAMM|nr:phosphoribosylglycinamide formyltransferase [Mizugakiibacter sediminis]GAP66480.1 formyltetrahydrofolate-dependentphosphoribosylglycinamide formyltransferase [Mizugakiibacter sediminis]
MSAAYPIAVLASGRGSNLAALIEAQRAGALPVAFTLVASDKADARALRIAEAHGIPTLALDPRGYASRRDYDLDLFARIAATRPALVVLAGFMRILDADAVAPWHGRMLNIHPSLLPKYRGLHTHRRVLEAGDAEHGSSVHFVTAELDGGPVVAQARIAVAAGDTPETLAARLLPLEHRLLVASVALIAAGRLGLGADGPWLDGRPLRAPLQLQADGALAAAA